MALLIATELMGNSKAVSKVTEIGDGVSKVICQIIFVWKDGKLIQVESLGKIPEKFAHLNIFQKMKRGVFLKLINAGYISRRRMKWSKSKA